MLLSARRRHATRRRRRPRRAARQGARPRRPLPRGNRTLPARRRPRPRRPVPRFHVSPLSTALRAAVAADALSRLRHFSRALRPADARVAPRFCRLLLALYRDSPPARPALQRLLADRLAAALQPPAGIDSQDREAVLARFLPPLPLLAATAALLVHPPAGSTWPPSGERPAGLPALLGRLVEAAVSLEPAELRLDKTAVFDDSPQGRANAQRRAALLGVEITAVYVRTAGIERIRRAGKADPAVLAVMAGQVRAALENLVVAAARSGNVETAEAGRGEGARGGREDDFGGERRASGVAGAAASAGVRGGRGRRA